MEKAEMEKKSMMDANKRPEKRPDNQMTKEKKTYQKPVVRDIDLNFLSLEL